MALDIIHSAVGSITESDVLLASASKAIILGFHTRIDTGVSDIAKREGVQIKLYAIIYELIDEVKEAMAGLLAVFELGLRSVAFRSVAPVLFFSKTRNDSNLDLYAWDRRLAGIGLTTRF